MQPIIGITAGRELSDTNIQKICLIDKYSSAITNSGGIPIIIPVGLSSNSLEGLISKFDGIMITGGGDIETNRFAGEHHSKVYGVDPDRDQLEIELVLAAIRLKKSLLGICRGIQIINVALGGDLFTDITDQKPGSLRHDWFPDFPRDLLSHPLEIMQNSLLHRITNLTEIEVNSLHHQAIKNLSPSLQASAIAPDGVIEAVEKSDHPFFLGVQWHPEWLFSLETTQKIFHTFVDSSKSNG